jgi:hypothetical protein
MSFDHPVVREYLTVLLYGLPVILILGKFFFGSWAGFFECVQFMLMPDLLSLLRGEWGQDQWASLKLLVFLALCAGAVFSAHRFFYG